MAVNIKKYVAVSSLEDGAGNKTCLCTMPQMAHKEKFKTLMPSSFFSRQLFSSPHLARSHFLAPDCCGQNFFPRVQSYAFLHGSRLSFLSPVSAPSAH